MADNLTKSNPNSTGNFTYNDYYFHIYEKVAISSAVIISLIAAVTVIANGISLFAIFKDPLKCFRNPFAIFITGILVSDFLTGLVVEPVFVALYTFWLVEIDEESYFRLIRSVQILSAVTINTSFLTALALAVVQLMALRWPSAFRRCVSSSKAILGIVFIWVYAILFALIPEMGKINAELYFILDLILHQMLLSVVMVIIYIVIYFMFVRAMRRHQSATNTPDATPAEAPPAALNEDQPNHDYEENRPENPLATEKIEKEFLIGSFILIVFWIITVWPFSISWCIMMFRSDNESEDTFLRDYIALIVFDDVLFLKFFLDPLIFVWRLPKYRKAISIVLTGGRVWIMSFFRGGSLPSATYHRQETEDSGEERLIPEREWSADISGTLEIKDEEA